MTLTKSSAACIALWTICAGYFLILLLLGLDRHWSLKTSIYDTGVFDQAIWSCLNGNILLNTINFSAPINWLGFHFHPILFLFVPLYKLSPSPEWLIAGQALAITLAAIPVYKTAIKLNFPDWQGIFWAISFLFNPFVLSAAIWDFHPVAIATPIIGFSIYYIISNRFGKLLLCASILLLCQEQFGLLVICLGISNYIFNRNVKQSLGLVLLGTAYTMIVFMYVFPALSPTGSHIMMTSEGKSLNRYNWLGNSLPAVIRNILLNPLTVLKISLIDMASYKDILLLLVPYGAVLPILGMEILLIGSADFAANILSLGKLQHSIYGYHAITLIPVIVIASMVGLNRIRKMYSTRQCQRIVFLCLISFVSLFIICIPHVFGRNSFWTLSLFPVKDPIIGEIQSSIPGDASLSVQANIGPHFSQRNRLYAYPNKVSEADFIILKLDDIDHTLTSDRFRFIHHMLMEPENYVASIKCLLDSRNYAIHFFKPPWLVFSKRHNKNSKINPESIYIFLDRIENQWNLDVTRLNLIECSGTK